MPGSGGPGSLDAEVLCDRGDEETGVLAPGTYSLHYEVFGCFSLLEKNVVSCLLWVVKRELVLSVFPYSQHFSNGKAVDEMVLVLLSSLLFRGLGIKSHLHSC